MMTFAKIIQSLQLNSKEEEIYLNAKTNEFFELHNNNHLTFNVTYFKFSNVQKHLWRGFIVRLGYSTVIIVSPFPLEFWIHLILYHFHVVVNLNDFNCILIKLKPRIISQTNFTRHLRIYQVSIRTVLIMYRVMFEFESQCDKSSLIKYFSNSFKIIQQNYSCKNNYSSALHHHLISTWK